jgi:hypothetical protein
MSTWGDVAATVAKVAPILGNILPGVGTVVGAGVGAAASMVASALGVSADPDSVMSALKNDPEAQIAAQREAAQLAAQTAQYQADAADRQSARAMATADKEHTPRNLAYIYTFALIFVIAAHFYIVIAKIVIDPAAFTILGNIEGVLIAMVLGSKEFYFGSSSSAVKQQAAITDFATTPGAVTAPASTTTTTIQSPSNQPQAVTVAPADNLYRGS